MKKRIADSREYKKWEKSIKTNPSVYDKEGMTFKTESGIPMKALYTPDDLDAINFNYEKDLGYPGFFPSTRGISPGMYRENLVRLKQYVGYGSPEETNALYKYLIAQGQNAISIAYDLPTQSGYDSDDLKVEGEVGKIGVPICSLKDWEQVTDGIDLERITINSVCNAQASIGMAWHIATAEKRGIKAKNLKGLVQNDILKEFIARGNYVFPPEPSMRLVADMMVYAAKHVPNYVPMYICCYHIREAGANAVQEIAFGICNGIAYIEETLKRGLNIDDIAPRITCLITGRHRDFLEEICKFRAIRRMWARIMKERFGAKDHRSYRLSIWDYEGGIGFTPDQHEINMARAAIAALVGALGGVQDIGLCTVDEALGTPSEKSLTLALRTAQIVVYETGVTHTVDPLAGSYFVEHLTHALETRANEYIKKVDELGGMVKAVGKGYPQREILKSAYNYQMAEEEGERIVIAGNKFVSEKKEKTRGFYRPQPKMVQKHIMNLKQLRAKRDNAKVATVLTRLKKVAERPAGNGNNLMPPIIEAVKAYATVGEIMGALREIFGEYQEVTGL
jgi:methylmalonyl-CoA mutase N-terminal domain/subunit